MSNDFMGLMRDVIVLAYMVGLRVGVPLLITLFAGKWIQRKLAERDQAEERALKGEPFCWDKRRTAQTAGAQAAATAHPELPCWLAVQAHGNGLIEACFNCPRYATSHKRSIRKQVEAR
jgi:hypothetical protein